MAYQRQLVSARDFDAMLAQPENADRNFELIGGEIVEVPSNTQSSEIAMTIGTHFKMHLLQHQIEGHITGEAGLYDINGERYAPDVAFKRSDTTRDYVDPNPPELVVEVVSPSDDPRQLSIKVSNYLAVGTVVWVVYGDDPQVIVHTPGKGAQPFGLEDTLTYAGLPGFELTDAHGVAPKLTGSGCVLKRRKIFAGTDHVRQVQALDLSRQSTELDCAAAQQRLESVPFLKLIAQGLGHAGGDR